MLNRETADKTSRPDAIREKHVFDFHQGSNDGERQRGRDRVLLGE